MTDEPASRPTLRLVRGAAEPEELAALVAVLSARGGPEEGSPSPRPRIGRWADPGAAVRGRLDPGPGGWRAAGRPR